MMSASLTKEQTLAFASFRAGANLYLTGKGGSGKSYLTRCIIDWCKSKGKKVVVCAPTGIAANNIGGATVHRTFRVPIGIIPPKKDGKDTRCYDKKRLEALREADVIVIDEISMCRIDVFEYLARTILSLPKTKDGRLQILLVGDFFQLPPVLIEDDARAFSAFFQDRLYAFESRYWSKLHLKTMELQESMRQEDKDFVRALDSIREGIPSFDVFSTCGSNTEVGTITICGRNKDAESINKKQVAKLVKDGAEEFVSEAHVKGDVRSSDWMCEKTLRLCRGARVLMISNDGDRRWVNGSMGIVESTDPLCIRMDHSRLAHEVEQEQWDLSEYVVEEDDDGKKKLSMNVRGSIIQYPVKLAWAISIHKSQGQTFDRVNIDIKNIFACGQLYVALSRCKSLNGLHIVGDLTEDKVIVSKAVQEFMKGSNAPTFEGPMLPFPEDSEEDGNNVTQNTKKAVISVTGNKSTDYQEGYEDGYEDGSNVTEEKYQRMIGEDPGVKRLGKYAQREHEKDLLAPEERNPKGAGRKPMEGLRKKNKVVRVPDEIHEIVKKLANRLQTCSDEQMQMIQERLSELLDEL